MQEASHIPTDLDACQSLILEQARALLDMQKSTEDQSNKIVELELQIDKLIKHLYGPKSERSVDDPNQLTLNFGDDEQSKDAIADAVIEAEKIVQEFTVRREITKKNKPRNEQLPDHLERYEVTAKSSESDTHCAEHGERCSSAAQLILRRRAYCWRCFVNCMTSKIAGKNCRRRIASRCVKQNRFPC
jgi:hypothetical protein